MIKESLVNAISSLSKKHQIHTSELRIRISKKEDSLKYEIMKNKDILVLMQITAMVICSFSNGLLLLELMTGCATYSN